VAPDPPVIRAEQVILGGISGGVFRGRRPGRRPRRDGSRLPVPLILTGLDQAFLGAVRRHRRVTADLHPVQRDDPQPGHPQLRAQDQDLLEHRFHRRRGLRPEPGDRHMIGHVTGADHPERDILLTGPLDPPRGPHALRPRPHQQGQQHVRVIPGTTNPTRPAMSMHRGGVQLTDRRDHQPHRMIRRQPLPHIRRHQKLLIPIHRSITLGHQHILPKHAGQDTDDARRPFCNSPSLPITDTIIRAVEVDPR